MNIANEVLLDLVVASYRLAKGFSRAVTRLPANEQPRHVNEISFFVRRLDSTLEPLSLSIAAVEGHRYDAGLPVKALNLDDFTPDDVLLVEQVVEPVIIGSEGVVRMGTVLLKKV